MPRTPCSRFLGQFLAPLKLHTLVHQKPFWFWKRMSQRSVYEKKLRHRNWSLLTYSTPLDQGQSLSSKEILLHSWSFSNTAQYSKIYEWNDWLRKSDCLFWLVSLINKLCARYAKRASLWSFGPASSSWVSTESKQKKQKNSLEKLRFLIT